MRADEYLNAVTEQIRCKKARPAVAHELEQHILDQAEDYRNAGFHEDEAMEKAVKEMGDPVEAGVALDRIHRPQMSWEMLGIIGLLSLTGVALMYAMQERGMDVSWQTQAGFMVIGFAAMLAVYRLDYSILGKYGKQAAALFLLLLFLGRYFFGVKIHGLCNWIRILSVDLTISEMSFLYLPLYGAVLYSCRGQEYRVFLKLAVWAVIPLLLVQSIPSLTTNVILAAGMYALTALAVWKDWYQVNRKRTLGVMAAGMILVPMLLIGCVYGFGEAYQIARLQAFFSGNDAQHYMVGMAQDIRGRSELFGESGEALELIMNGPTGEYLTDYILVGMCSVFGILAVLFTVVLFTVMILRIFRISFSQKNQLGTVIGCSCGLVFFFKTVLCVLNNFQYVPYLSISLPFLSYGGTAIVVSYILLGLVLSIYRYKNILSEQKKRKNSHITETM
ncbi:MAG: FtsW/RodA/SpoVE family cell cycle protein [Lachnospiraceae bacterium]